MKRCPIRFQDTNDIVNFVRIVNQYDFDVDVRKGPVIMDAKSFLGVLSMSETSGLEMVIHGADYGDILSKVHAYLD